MIREENEPELQSRDTGSMPMKELIDSVDPPTGDQIPEEEKAAPDVRIQSSMSSVTHIDEPVAALEDLEPCLENDDAELQVVAEANEPEVLNDDVIHEDDEQNPDVENEPLVEKEMSESNDKGNDKIFDAAEQTRPEIPNEGQAIFPDSVYEPFARKNLKSKTSVQFTASPPSAEKPDRTVSRRTTSAVNPKLVHNEFESPQTAVFKYFSRQNSFPAIMQTSTFDPINITSEDPEFAKIFKTGCHNSPERGRSPVEPQAMALQTDEVTSVEASPDVGELEANIENIDPEVAEEPEEVESEETEQDVLKEEPGPSISNYEQPRTHRFTVPIKLPKSHTDSSPIVTNHFYDGSYVAESPQNGRASKSTVLPALKSLNGKKGKSYSIDEPSSGGGIILPNIEPLKAGMEGPRGELRKQLSLHNMGSSSPTKQKIGANQRQNSNKESSPTRPERPEISTIRGPHPKWLVNHNHLQQKRTSILSESLPVEEKLLKRQRFMMRSKRFQDPLNNRLSLVPGLTEKENSSFHEIRQKLGQIENKIEHIIKHSSHLSRSIDRPNSDSFLETNRQLLIPRNHQVFLQQTSMLNGGHGAFTHYFDHCKNNRDEDSSAGEGFEDDRKLNVVNIVLEGENSQPGTERHKSYPFSFAMEPGNVLHQIHQQYHHRSFAPSQTHTPVSPNHKVPLLTRAQQENGAKSYISATSHPLHIRQPTQSLGNSSTPPGPPSTNVPKVRRKDQTYVKSSKINKTSNQKGKASLTVKIHNNDDRASETSSEGNRTIDETVVLRSHGEIELSPW